MKNTLRLLTVAICVVPILLLLGAATPASADDPPQLGLLATINAATLFPTDDPVFTDPAASVAATTDPPHLPPGGKFKLFGNAKDDTDPDPNPFNEVISFDTTGTSATNPLVAGAFKLFGDHVKIHMLDNQVELKYFFAGTKTCGGDSPRFQLGMDTNGDGQFDGNAFGHIGDKPFGGGCPTNMWVYEDMTNTVKKWDLSQFPGSAAFCGGNAMLCSWQDMENFFSTLPNHRVLNEVLVDDSFFFPLDSGCGYYDLVSAGARTLTNWDDTNDNPSATNNC